MIVTNNSMVTTFVVAEVKFLLADNRQLTTAKTACQRIVEHPTDRLARLG